MLAYVIKFSILFLITYSTAILVPSSILAAEKTIASQQDIPSLTVNINNASAEEIADIMTGVGLNKAKGIVKYRDKIGEFKSIEQLLEVKGIGAATLKKNRQRLKL